MSHYLSGIPLIKKRIEIQLSEYEAAIDDAVEWYRGWKARQAAAETTLNLTQKRTRWR